MADPEKKARSIALANFTRQVKLFHSLVEQENVQEKLVTPQYEKVVAGWERLESTQDSFLGKTAIDIENEPHGLAFLNEPEERYSSVMSRYSQFLERTRTHEQSVASENAEQMRLLEISTKKQTALEEEQERKRRSEVELRENFQSVWAEFLSAIETFGRVNRQFQVSVGGASDQGILSEWQKVETDYNGLKDRMVHVTGIYHGFDLAEIKDTFLENVEGVYMEVRQWFLGRQVEAVLNTSGGGASVGAVASKVSNATKKEAVRLPSFKGDEKSSPYLKFPVWKKQWDCLITEYEEKWRAGLLWDHIDEVARSKFVGWETDYAEAIKRLERFYGNPLKVVSCVMKEVSSQSYIAEGDYSSLLEYSVCLENNFNRLSNLDLLHEMSNSSTLSVVLRKFPRSVSEKWQEHLCSQDFSVKARPFLELVVWLASQRDIWEGMLANEQPKKGVDSNKLSFFGYEETIKDSRVCYKCGQKGHVQRDCQGSEMSGGQAKKTRKVPKVKKYWCAFHKGDASRSCFSDSCKEIRTADKVIRVNLLEENGDCLHCCGDHKAADCYRKERVCGGGKVDRGCNKSHNML